MVSRRAQVVAPLAALLVAAGTCMLQAQVPPRPNDATPASFWSTPASKTPGDGWTKGKAAPDAPTSKPATTIATTVARPAPLAVAAKPVSARQGAPRRAARPTITLAWRDDAPTAASSSAAVAVPPTPGEPTPAPAAPDLSAAPADAAPLVVIGEGIVTSAPATTPPEPQQVMTPMNPVKRGVPAAAPASTAFPAWMTFNVQYRGRVEATRSVAVAGSENDPYYLNRLRIRALFTVSKYFDVFGEGQDSRVADYDGGVLVKAVVLRGMRNVFDVRQGYVDLHAANGKSWRLRVGRQELAFGDGRLVASPDWGNANRTFDVVRASVARGRARVDVFGGYVVQLDPDLFDQRKQGEYLYGAWGLIDKVAPQTAIEPFVIVKHNNLVLGEDAVIGDATLVTIGGRATSKLWNRVDIASDLAIQQGSFSNDDIRSWAFHQLVAVPLAKQPWKPRLAVDYATASGDNDPKDGRKQTFDQLYSSNHARYGLADQIGWRNMHDIGVMVDATPLKPLKVGFGAHRLFLATVNDGLYGSGGTRVVLNRKATSRDVGVELDSWFQWTVSKEVSVAGGLSTLQAGDYLKESTDGRRLWAPYLLWNVKF